MADARERPLPGYSHGPGLDPAIHKTKTWIPGTSRGMPRKLRAGFRYSAGSGYSSPAATALGMRSTNSEISDEAMAQAASA
jgi:hypothetical protein